MKITLKESEFKALIENKIKKVLSETELGYTSDIDPVDDNVSPFGLIDWLEENYPEEISEGMIGYEKIIKDLKENNNLTIEIIDFFIKDATAYVEGCMHNLEQFKNRCEQYKSGL